MADAALPPLPANYEFSVISRHGNALPARQRWLFFGVLVAFSLGVGFTLSAWGAWPVLPYSLLETGIVCAAFWYVERHAHDWERLTVVQDRIIVERSCGGRRERRELNRHWTRVELEDGGSGLPRRARLAVRSAGTALEFGEALPAEERVRIARELRRLIGA